MYIVIYVVIYIVHKYRAICCYILILELYYSYTYIYIYMYVVSNVAAGRLGICCFPCCYIQIHAHVTLRMFRGGVGWDVNVTFRGGMGWDVNVHVRITLMNHPLKGGYVGGPVLFFLKPDTYIYIHTRIIHIHIYIYIFIYLSIYLIYLSIYLSNYLSIYPSVYLSIHPSIHLSISMRIPYASMLKFTSCADSCENEVYPLRRQLWKGRLSCQFHCGADPTMIRA